MSDNDDSIKNESGEEQELTPVFMQYEEVIENKEKIDYSKVYVLPSIKTRYFSILIDVIVIFVLSIGISTLLDKIGPVPGYVRGILFVVVVILYEPILVTFGTTVGQLLLNLRVRSFKNPEVKLAFPFIFLRFIVKIFLGWLSFLTVTFNVNRRAIHDFASGSIMIANKIENT